MEVTDKRQNALAYYVAGLITTAKSFIMLAPGACTIKHYGFIMYSFHSKLECLSKPVNVTDNIKNSSLLHNLSIFCSLQFHNALLYRPRSDNYR